MLKSISSTCGDLILPEHISSDINHSKVLLRNEFTNNDTVKIALDASIINPAQFLAIEPTLSNVISREENKNSMSISDIRWFPSIRNINQFFNFKIIGFSRYLFIC